MTSPRSQRHRRPLLQGRYILFLLAFIACGGAASAAELPTGFTESLVASGLSNPTAMAIAPDGRIFVCEQGGALRVIKDGVLLTPPFVQLTVSSASERGLLGVAFDPEFATNQYLYVYYTATTPTIHNRVSRFTANGDVAETGSRVDILDLETLNAGNHNGGAIHFGPADGKLYVAVGENAVPSNAQMLANRLGKMLRINSNGTIPGDNPFVSTSGANGAIWAYGLRNPFTFAFNPGGTEMFINDVGANTYEEINVGNAGANYGWPDTEGPTNDPRFVEPRYSYNQSGLPCAISGAAFYSPVTFRFPLDYASDYFFADLCAGWIRRLDLTTNVATEFASGISGPVDVHVAADGHLYYLARGSGSDTGVVYRVQYNNPTPGESPAAPALTSYTNGLTLALRWTTSAGATSYRLEGGSSPGLANLLNIDVGNVTALEAPVPAGTYVARVRAVNAQGVSAPSNEVTVTLVGPGPCATPPPPPTGYAAQTSGLNVVLTWNASPSATSYVLEAGSASGLANQLNASVGAVTSFAATAPAATYFTRVRAANACGRSAPSAEVPVTLTCAATPPTNLTASKSGALVIFNWTGSASATSYHAQVGSAPGLSNLLNVNIGAATAQSVSIAGVAPGNYYVRMVAITSCGTTGPSNEVVVSVP